MTWRVALGPGRAGTIEGEPTEWTDLSVTLPLMDAAEAKLTIDGRSAATEYVRELATDMWVWWDTTLLFRGRIVAADDSLDRDTHRIDLAAVDYRGLLDRRVLIEPDTVSFTNIAQATIAWNLIAAAQAKPGGNLGITAGWVPAGQTVVYAFEYGTSIAEAIGKLSETTNGFDWAVGPDLVFNAWNPLRGANTGVILDYGGSVDEVGRTSAASGFANVVRLAGASNTTTPVTSSTPGLGADTRGRWELAVNESDLALQAQVNARAPRLLADRDSPPNSYRLRLAPGAYVTTEVRLSPGDWATLIVRSGRLDVNERVRVTEVAIDATEDGDDTVNLAVVADP